jgi:TonB-dependent SusC/RagA subfamily outer membrane receptor
LKTIVHDDVESINVLKDKAAVTMYGEKGKDGVIVITTKK